jgi:methylmalonyl-CoA/ethylmalonyl-CoA epimerase
MKNGPGPAKRIDHVAIVVRDVDASLPYYVDVLGMTVSGQLELEDGSARVAYLEIGDTSLQLLEPLKPGALADFLRERGEGLHHICLEVDDISNAVGVLDKGTNDDGIRRGGRGDRVSFIAARPNGVPIELSERTKA